jgi:hypothetical protein
MSPEDPSSDPSAADRDRLRYELSTPLTVITGRAQLLQRQLLRANGLVNLERDQMLGNLAALLTEVHLLSTRIESVIGLEAAPCGSPAHPPPSPPRPESPR